MHQADCGQHLAPPAYFELVEKVPFGDKRERGSMLILAVKVIQNIDERFV